MSRRALLTTTLATSVTLAGCTNDTEPADSSKRTTEGSEQTIETTVETTIDTTETTTKTEKTTEDPAPTLAEFAYPDGASQEGIDGAALFRTHESKIREIESATVKSQIDKTADTFEETIAATKQYSPSGILERTEDVEDSRVESLWSPAKDQPAYVQFKSRSDERYRIDDQSPTLFDLMEFHRFGSLLRGAAWSEASKVLEVGENDYAVLYESVGITDEEALSQLGFGNQVSEFEAQIAVTESGHVSEIDYDITLEREDGSRREEVNMQVGSLGETVVEEPAWVEKSRTEGVRFESQVTDDRTAVELEMVNGSDVPTETRVSVSDGSQRGEATLADPLTVGDRVYLSLSDGGELRISTDEAPDGTSRLNDSFVRVVLYYQGFPLFIEEITES